jgi:hypothetical protein
MPSCCGSGKNSRNRFWNLNRCFPDGQPLRKGGIERPMSAWLGVRRNPCTGLKAFALVLTVSLATLTSAVRAQEPSIAEPYKKWLNCTIDWIFTEETVGPNFSLKVAFHGTPVAGNRITLNKDSKVAATATTNRRGIAQFDSIPPGKYDPESPDGLLFPSGRLVIEVKAEQASGDNLSMDWPNYSVAYRLLRGRFTTSEREDDPEIPLRNTVVELRDVYTARLIESGSTDVNGDYQFSTTDPGLYALRLVLPKKGHAGFENRDLAVELDPSAKEYSIPEMKVVQSDCYGVELLRRSPTEDLWEAQ